MRWLNNGDSAARPLTARRCDRITVGDLSFAVEYRHVGEEQGPTVHVFGDVDGVEEEILRFDCFDCFDRTPHYHYGFSYIEQPLVLIDKAAIRDRRPARVGVQPHRDALAGVAEGRLAPAHLAASCDAGELRAVASELLSRCRALSALT